MLFRLRSPQWMRSRRLFRRTDRNAEGAFLSSACHCRLRCRILADSGLAPPRRTSGCIASLRRRQLSAYRSVAHAHLGAGTGRSVAPRDAHLPVQLLVFMSTADSAEWRFLTRYAGCRMKRFLFTAYGALFGRHSAHAVFTTGRHCRQDRCRHFARPSAPRNRGEFRLRKTSSPWRIPHSDDATSGHASFTPPQPRTAETRPPRGEGAPIVDLH